MQNKFTNYLKASTAILVILNSTLCIAYAGKVEKVKESGLYVDTNVGLAYSQSADDFNQYKGYNNNFGLVINPDIGYQFNKHFAVELGYISLPDVGHLYDAAIKGIIPLNSQYSLFGKIGGTYNSSGVGVLASFGGSYALSSRTSLNVAVSHAFESNNSIGSTTFGTVGLGIKLF